MSRRLKTQAITGLAAVLTAASFAALAVDNLDIADVPLLNAVAVDPNIMFVIDDSGSMSTETLGNDFLAGGQFVGPRYAFPTAVNTYGGSINPDNITVPDFDDNNPLNTAVRNAQSNPAYYDPQVTYLPWVNADGSLMPDADPACARHHPSDERCRNLTVDHGTGGNEDLEANDPNGTAYARALFIAANGRINGGTVNLSLNNNADFEDNAEVIPFYPAIYYQRNANGSFTRVEIRDPSPDNLTGIAGDNVYPGGPDRTDCGDDGDPLTLDDDADPTNCTYAQEIQNFANWYTYHRSRILIARSSVGRTFAQLDENRRVGFDRINNTGTPVVPIRQDGFTDQNRAEFLNELYDHIVDGNTPLLASLKHFENQRNDFGKYEKYYGLPFEKPDDRHKWFFCFDEAMDFFQYHAPKKDYDIEEVFFLGKGDYRHKLLRKLAPRLYRNFVPGAFWIILRLKN